MSPPTVTRSRAAEHPEGVQATDEELAEVNLITDAFHGEWNYTIAPRVRRKS
jgi:hypothetical protein